MNRRTFLRTTGVVGAAGLAGCSGLFETREIPREPPLVEDRPDVVYYPTHVEGMAMAGMAMQGRHRLALTYSFPHRFWLMGGGTAEGQERVNATDDDDVHLMATLWDAETETVLPVGDVQIELSKGDWSETRPMWPMLSQNMGFHFGDNVTLDGDGEYEAEIRIAGLSGRRTGALAGEFGETVTLSTTFEYSEDERDDVRFERLDERKGDEGAVEPMEMDMPVSRVPPKGDLPGRPVGEGESGDARFVVTAVEDSDLAEGTYLLVSPRTPYNRYPLPMMSLSATLTRDGETIFDDALTQTLDSDLGYHYGASVNGIESGDDLTVRVDSPPQVSRHEGYETAFITMPKMEFTV